MMQGVDRLDQRLRLEIEEVAGKLAGSAVTFDQGLAARLLALLEVPAAEARRFARDTFSREDLSRFQGAAIESDLAVENGIPGSADTPRRAETLLQALLAFAYPDQPSEPGG